MKISSQIVQVFFIVLIGGFPLLVSVGCAKAHVSCPNASLKSSVHPPGVFADGVVAFEASGNTDFPVNVVLYRDLGKCTASIVDRYEYEGAPPVVASVFPYTVHGAKNLFVIVSWSTSHPGAGISGALYQVYAYRDNGRGGLVSSEAIASLNEMTGIEGEANFEESHFDGKNPSEVKDLVDRLGMK